MAHHFQEDMYISTGQDVMLRWSPYRNAISYNLQYSNSSTFPATGTTTITGITGTNYTLNSLIIGRRYFFRIQAVIPTGKSMYSLYRWFNVR